MTIIKLLVVSDVHRDHHSLERIIEHHKDNVDDIISLGDSECSLDYLKQKNIIAVKGNYPFDGGEGYHKTLHYEDIEIFITHGHKFGVKWGSLSRLHEYAKSEHYDLVMYGHTHEASYEIEEGIVYINPGSVRQPRGRHEASYAIVTINQKKITVSFFDVKTFQEMTI
ncbi:MAG: metallophosphoesterase family protein [Candidatus Izemoplasmataceae bacterium]